VLDALQLENLGKPTLTIVQDRFEKAAKLHAKAGGLPNIPLLVEAEPADGGSIRYDVHDLIQNHRELILSALTSGELST
jgi:hypothetical protein